MMQQENNATLCNEHITNLHTNIQQCESTSPSMQSCITVTEHFRGKVRNIYFGKDI